jgi:hypothetical protein
VPTLEFRIEVHDFPIDGRPFREVRAVDWIETEITIEGAMNASTGAPGRPRHEDKGDAVLAVLSDEPQGQRAIAEASGVPRSTVQRILDQLEYDGAIRVERGWVGQEGVAPNSTKKKWPPTAFQCRTRIWLYRANPVAHGMARTRWPKVLHWTLGPPLTTSAMMAITTIVKGCSTISESSVCDARGRLPRHRDDGHGRAPGSARGRRFRARGSRAAPLFHDRDRDLIQRILELEGAIYVGHNGPGPGRVAPRTRSDLACHIQVNAGWAGI